MTKRTYKTAKAGAATAAEDAVEAAATQYAANAAANTHAATAAAKTEELLIDYLEDEMNAQDRAVVSSEVKSSVKLRRTLEDLAAVRLEISKTVLVANPRIKKGASFAELHKRIMANIDNA